MNQAPGLEGLPAAVALRPSGACRVLLPSGAIRRQQQDKRSWPSSGNSTLTEAPLEPARNAAPPRDAPGRSPPGSRRARKRPADPLRPGGSPEASRRKLRIRTKRPERARRMSLSATHRPPAPGTTLPGIDAPSARSQSAETVRSLAHSRSAATFSAMTTASGRVAAISARSSAASGVTCFACAL